MPTLHHLHLYRSTIFHFYGHVIFILLVSTLLIHTNEAFALTFTSPSPVPTSSLSLFSRGSYKYSSSSSNENESASPNDALLDSLENQGNSKNRNRNSNNHSNNNNNASKGGISANSSTGSTRTGVSTGDATIDPSPDSLASLRDLATSNVANFLSAFAQPPSSDDNDNNSQSSSEAAAYSSSNQNQNQNNNDTAEQLIPLPLPPSVQWDVYICQSKQSKERGASATLDSFQALVPSSSNDIVINIHPAILSKTKAKGPNVRCIQKTPPYKAFEVNNVNDVDKVYRILVKHMNIPDISTKARDCLKYTYQGNAHLEKNELTAAISSYNSALDTQYEPQEGMLLLLRATAYLKRAFQHQDILRQTVTDLGEVVPEPASLGRLYQLAETHPSLAKSIFNKVLTDTKIQDKQFRQTKYRHGLYEYALLHAAQDSLRSTQLLPHHAKTWLRAGDALAELRKLKESAMYYEKAIELDPTLKDRLEPVIERLKRSQEFLDKARGWWSSDTLRLALDVAG